MHSKKDKKECVHIFEALDLKLTAIVAGPACPTRPLGNIVDIILKPFLLLSKVKSKITVTSYQKVQKRTINMPY